MEPTEMVTGLSSTLLMSQINTDLRYDFFVAVLHFMQVIYFPLNICLNKTTWNATFNVGLHHYQNLEELLRQKLC